MPRLEDIGLIGNGQLADHVAAGGEMVRCCLPRLDLEPDLAGLQDATRGDCFQAGPAAGGAGRHAERLSGSNHARFEGSPAQPRLTTDVPLSCFGGQPFAMTGRRHLETSFEALSPLGLLSEDFDPAARRLWGHLPRACWQGGLTHAAFDASPRWPGVP
jgi:hypothetical protein